MNSRRLSAARVAATYTNRYDFIVYPKAWPDASYWGFEGEGADAAAAALADIIIDSTSRMEALGRKIEKNIRAALALSGGVEDSKERAEVRAAVQSMKDFSKREWMSLAEELLSYSDVDADPSTSRTKIEFPYEQIYRQFAERAAHPAMADLRDLYQQLRVKVDSYFQSL